MPPVSCRPEAPSHSRRRQLQARCLILVCALCVSLGIALPAGAAQTVSPQPFDVFVDPPTGFVFVRLPTAWKFVGTLSALEVKALPATVITSLLPAGEGDSSAVAQLPRPPQP